MPTTNILLNLMGTPADQVNSFNWSCAISCGLPVSSVSTLANILGWTEDYLAANIGVTVPTKSALLLDSVASEAIFRLSQIYSELKLKTSWSSEKLSAWLTSENAQLRKRVPLDLLRSALGYEYVLAAITRI